MLLWQAGEQSRTVFLSACYAERLPLCPYEAYRRLDEVARLLALGFLRLRARRHAEKANGPNHLRELGLDFAAEGSVGDTDTGANRERP